MDIVCVLDRSLCGVVVKLLSPHKHGIAGLTTGFSRLPDESLNQGHFSI